MVEPMVEGHIIVTDISCQLIEHDNVFDDTLVVLHDNIVESVLSIPNWVKSAKVHVKVAFKFLEVSHPGGHRVLGEDVGLEPFKSGAPEV